ncbi:MAG: hypothetical protein ACJ8DC_17625 [Gemmatimonadales bacterium]
MVEHPIRLRGPALAGVERGPLVLQRTEDDFIGAVLDELSTPGGIERVVASEAKSFDEDGLLKLFHPVQRTYHVVLLEAVCDTLLTPRLDPAAIESAGFVVRRTGLALGQKIEGKSKQPAPSDPRLVEGWREQPGRIRGWVQFLGSREGDLDPDPAHRAPPLRSGNAEIDRRLAERALTPELLSEAWAPLFVAPPEVIGATGRTLLYGVVPVTSEDVTTAETPTAYPTEDVKALTANLLYSTSGIGVTWSHGGETLTAQHLKSYRDDAGFQSFLAVLRQLAFQYGAFDDAPQGRAIYAQLERLTLPLPGGAQVTAGSALRDAARLFLFQDPQVSGFIMPTAWPLFTPQHSADMLAALKAALDARLRGMRPEAPRFDDPARQFRLRAFVRQQRDCIHPPDWSGYGSPFRIAPWYESSGRPPVRIELPGIDRDFLKKLKPNVAFAMPAKTFNLLQNIDPKGLIDGESQSDAGIDIAWICQFNLVIIFVLAFMVMFVFLLVFDIVFQWMLFVKICLPIPKKA